MQSIAAQIETVTNYVRKTADILINLMDSFVDGKALQALSELA